MLVPSKLAGVGLQAGKPRPAQATNDQGVRLRPDHHIDDARVLGYVDLSPYLK